MNVSSNTIRLLSIIGWLSLGTCLSGQITCVLHLSDSSNLPALSDELSDYHVFTINSRSLYLQLEKQPNTELWLDFGESRPPVLLSLVPDAIRAADYTLLIEGENGARRASPAPLLTLSGDGCRLAVAEHFVYGFFTINDTVWYVEPAQRFGQYLPDAFLVYSAEAILPNPHGRCAGALLEQAAAPSLTEPAAARSCYEVEMALAADFSMLQSLGNEVQLEQFVLAILHSVRANYANEFAHDIRFVAKTLWVSACADCDPWSATTNYLELLSSFRAWGNAGGFSTAFDVASLWTGRVLDNQIAGGGYYSALCGQSRYNVLRRYSANAGLMRALQAHELGHNLNARHDNADSQTIMAPTIRNVNAWSDLSRNAINTYFNFALGLPNCVSTCPEERVPLPDFVAFTRSGCVPLQVQFYNASAVDAVEWYWTFEGGTPETSTLANPLIIFALPGFYRVTLQTRNTAGTTTLVKDNFITVESVMAANFAIQYTPGATSASLQNLSIGADSVRWLLPDESQSVDNQLIFDFKTDGLYPVSLIAYSFCGADTLTRTVQITTMPVATFEASPTEGCAPLQVQFVSQASANTTAVVWQFPGGVPANSTELAPVVQYPQPGLYRVVLQARNAAGTATISKNELIRVKPRPTADFTFVRTANIVRFSNRSSNADTHRWDFGDGSQSTNSEPTHTYAAPGSYLVTLIASNTCGNDTLQQIVHVNGNTPIARFERTATNGCAPTFIGFSDVSEGEPARRRWHFPSGEPSTSEALQPVVHYAQAGSYAVSLVVENFWGKDSLWLPDYITIHDQPSAEFSYVLNGTEFVFQADTIVSDWLYEWHFGDGNRSTQPNPTHTYITDGIFTVELIVRNICGSDTTRQQVDWRTTALGSNLLWIMEGRIFPNPNEGRFQLWLHGLPQIQLEVLIFNALGQVQLRRELDFRTGFSEEQFQLPAAATGVYWLQLRMSGGIIRYPFVVKK
ncbi:MAG TPA: PKD domain-containing protein [Saprospiraceae bacterium]|nr:PKD domain-containing protein [Saprospiraceae bacterium]